jgi:tRNA G18 (ribose-2'-O)-methylase SpoU
MAFQSPTIRPIYSFFRQLNTETKIIHPVQKKIERYRQLIASGKYRIKYGTFIVPGLVALQHVSPKDIISILACSKRSTEKLDKLVRLPKTVPIDFIRTKQYYALSKEYNPEGILAEVKGTSVHPFNIGALQGPRRWLGINEIRDGANMGLLIRAAGCLGWDGVIIIGPGAADPYCLASVRASAGAVLKVPIYSVPAFSHISTQIVFAEVPAKVPKENPKIDYGKPLVLVIGNEQHGHEGAQAPNKEQTKYISIPIRHDFGSLNAALAGAVLMNRINETSVKIK